MATPVLRESSRALREEQVSEAPRDLRASCIPAVIVLPVLYCIIVSVSFVLLYFIVFYCFVQRRREMENFSEAHVREVSNLRALGLDENT